MADDGKILVGSLALSLETLRANVAEANSILADIGKQSKKNATDISKAYSQMASNMTKAIKKVEQAENKSKQASAVKKATESYRQLTSAIREQQKALNTGNTNQQKYWSDRINDANKQLQLQRENVDSVSEENGARQKLVDTIQKGSNALDVLRKKESGAAEEAKKLEESYDRLTKKLQVIATIALAKMWHDALQYAKEFDKAITDIAIVTQVPIEQARELGREYRQLANDLNVTSTSIATAAATIARQGITNQDEIQGVIKGVTKFGAVTDLSTDEAIEVMTASMQNFRKETESAEDVVERIGDTWSYMGDAVATEGADIAEAMGKASASVASVGLEFEKASAYAAIMLAKTQQSGQVIGTQLNSLVARYAKITSKGYASITEDDEGEALSFNDVSKALREVGIEMYDVTEKTFLPIGEMFDQLSEKWGMLDEAQQKYIATTIGGTRGMNYFLTLMENYNEAITLQTEAEQNRGVVQEKYLIWMQSAEAAQNNLTNSLENLYAMLKAEYLADFYNGLAKIVDILADGTEGIAQWNLKLPLIAAGATLAAGAIASLSRGIGIIIGLIQTATLAMRGVKLTGGFALLLTPKTITAAVAALSALLTVVGLIISKIKDATHSLNDVSDIADNIATTKENVEKYREISTALEELRNKTSLTNEEWENFNTIRQQIIDDSPSMKGILGEESKSFESIEAAAEAAIVKLKKYEEQHRNMTDIMLPYKEKEYRTKWEEAYSNLGAITAPEDGVMGIDKYLKDLEIYFKKDDEGFLPEAGLKATYGELLQMYKDIDKFMSDPELRNNLFSSLEPDDEDAEEYVNDTISTLEDYYNTIIGLMHSKADEVEGLAEDLKAIVYDMFVVESGNIDSSIANNVLNVLDSANWGSMNLDNVKQFVSDYIKVFNSSWEDLSSEEMYSTLMGLSFNAFGEYGDMSDADVKPMIDYMWNYYENHIGKIKEELLGQISDIQLSPFAKSANELQRMIDEGELSEAMLRTLNKALRQAHDQAKSENKFAPGVQGWLLEEFLGMTEDERIEWSYTIDPTLKNGDEAGDAVKSDLMEFMDKLQGEIDNALSGEWGNKEELISIRDRLFAITNKEDESTGILETLENVDAINTLTDALNKMQAGEADESVISGLIEDFPMLTQFMGESSTAIEACSAMLDYLIIKYKDTAKAMGLVIDEQKDLSEQVLDSIAPMNSAQKAIEKLQKGDSLTVKEIAELSKEYPDLNRELEKYSKNTKNTARLIEALNDEYRNKAAQDFAKSVYDAMDAVDKAKEGTLEYNVALDNLGQIFTGGFADISSLDFALTNLNNIKAAINGDIEAFQALQQSAWVHISGTSNVDFSAVNNGIAIVGENSQRMAKWLESLGLFTTETATATANIVMPTISDGQLADQQFAAGATYTLLKPAKTNPFTAVGGKGSSSSGKGGSGGGSGGSGGGSGSSNVSVSKKTTKLLDNMEKQHDSYDNRRKITDLKREYHDIKGEIQGVIGYTEIEAQIIEEQNKVLIENLAALEDQMRAKEKTIASTKSSSKAHQQASADLEELNGAHKEYTELLLENKNRLEEIEKELKDYREQVRQTAISVQDMIRDTLEQYDEHQRSMLDGTVDLQDTILEVIQARYEKERDLAIETAEAKKEALQEEIDAIDELIDKRRELIDEEEEANEIAELEAKIARISADPTRRKELLQLQEQLTEKRKDQAWDTYEEEMKAQKESLEGQIDSLDDYIEYVNEYYEELFKNPEKLIAEMKEIIKQSDAEIIDWLKSNMEEFSSYTSEKKEQTIQDWQEIINQMRGVTETYQEEIEAVMKMTDEEIIAWLKTYNVEFGNATKEQQESFIHSWEQTLEEWRKAYEKVAAKVSTYDYKSGTTGSSSGSSGSSGSSKSSGSSSSSSKTSSSSSNKTTTTSIPATYKWKDSTSKWNTARGTGNTEATALVNAFEQAKKEALAHWKTKTGPGIAQAIQMINAATFNSPGNYFKEYKLGGMNYDTGWHWLDGTKNRPERILSAYQTQLFEDMIQTLHEIRRFSVNGISNFRVPEFEKQGGGGFNVESISVHVDRLDSDADYEELAERVGEAIMKEVTKGLPVGGIII